VHFKLGSKLSHPQKSSQPTLKTRGSTD